MTTTQIVSSEKTYVKYLIDMEKEINITLDYLSDAIEKKENFFMAFNPKTNQEEPVPIRRAIHFLQYACRFPHTIKPPTRFEDEHKLYKQAFSHLQKATRLLSFYCHNESFANDNVFNEIVMHINTYDDEIDHLSRMIEEKFLSDTVIPPKLNASGKKK